MTFDEDERHLRPPLRRHLDFRGLLHCFPVIETGFRSQAREFLFSSMFARESSKRVSILDRETGTKREGSDQAQTRQPGAESKPWIIGL